MQRPSYSISDMTKLDFSNNIQNDIELTRFLVLDILGR